MQRQVPDLLRAEWNRHLADLLGRTPWGKANRESVAAWSEADLAFWGDLFAWTNDRPPPEATKGFDLAALREGFYKIPRAGVLAADAAATFSEHLGRPTNLVATFFDNYVMQTAIYMNDGAAFGPDPDVVRENPAVFGPNPEALIAEMRRGRDAYELVQDRVRMQLAKDPQIVIAHSLGSVIAYEALCERKHNVHTFITIGSPLATPELILRPLKKRVARRLGRDPSLPLPWPNVMAWVNFFALADVWCVPVPRLAPVVDSQIRDVELHHGTMLDSHETHLLTSYLTHDAIGDAIAEAIGAIGARAATP
jgi:hypothetical protein